MPRGCDGSPTGAIGDPLFVKVVPPWPNGQGVGLLIRRLRVQVPQGVLLHEQDAAAHGARVRACAILSVKPARAGFGLQAALPDPDAPARPKATVLLDRARVRKHTQAPI